MLYVNQGTKIDPPNDRVLVHLFIRSWKIQIFDVSKNRRQPNSKRHQNCTRIFMKKLLDLFKNWIYAGSIVQTNK